MRSAHNGLLSDMRGNPKADVPAELGGVIEGLTLQLRKQGASADIAVASDREAVKTAVKAFSDAYNALALHIGEQTKYDPSSKTGGPLQGDSAAISLRNQFRGLLGEIGRAHV